MAKGGHGWRREPSGGGLTTRQQSDSIWVISFGWQGGEFADELIIVLKKNKGKNTLCLLAVFHCLPKISYSKLMYRQTRHPATP